MYTDETLRVIQDNQAFTHANGTKYPSNYPKDEIAGLYLVSETSQPTGDIVITGFHINEAHVQVWDYRSKTAEELLAEKQSKVKFEIIELESQITNRRLREAVLTSDGTKWLMSKEEDIELKRKELSDLQNNA